MKKFGGKAFTLVEILVVLAVLSILGIIILTIFSRSLRGNNKSQIIVALKQNGQSVLGLIDKSIRNADNVVCVSKEINIDPAKGTTVVIVKNGIYSRFRFVTPPNNNFNGLIRQDNPTPVESEIDPTVFINRVCNPADPMSVSSIVLTDINSQSGVSLTSGTFTRSKQAGFRDSIKIFFTLSPAFGTPQQIINEIDPVSFETTIQLR